MSREELIYPEEAYAIFGACFEVYNQMGNGFVEPVYQECLELEMEMRLIPFSPQQELQLSYRGRSLRRKYIPDFVCYENVVVEIKAVSSLTDEHRAQVHNYLAATGYQLGLLINFGHAKGVQYERIIYTRLPESCRKAEPYSPNSHDSRFSKEKHVSLSQTLD